MKPSLESKADFSAHLSNSQIEGTAFPHKLHNMLEIESSRMESCAFGSIQWEKHGLTFRILDATRFETETIPKYFKRKVLTLLNIDPTLIGIHV